MAIQSVVFINKKEHQYWDHEGNNYASVSRILSKYDEEFDAKKISAACAGRGKFANMTQEEVLKMWEEKKDKAANHGSRTHDALEVYSKEFYVAPENSDLEPMVKSICSEYIPYARSYSEEILYLPSLAAKGTFIAGTTDKVLVPSARGNYFDIEDYKTNEEIEFCSKYNKHMKEPISYLQSCNYNKYVLQISIYALMLEELTGKKVRRLWLRHIPKENPLGHYKIPVPYMKSCVINLLNHYHNNKSSNAVVMNKPSNNTIEIPTF